MTSTCGTRWCRTAHDQYRAGVRDVREGNYSEVEDRAYLWGRRVELKRLQGTPEFRFEQDRLGRLVWVGDKEASLQWHARLAWGPAWANVQLPPPPMWVLEASVRVAAKEFLAARFLVAAPVVPVPCRTTRSLTS